MLASCQWNIIKLLLSSTVMIMIPFLTFGKLLFLHGKLGPRKWGAQFARVDMRGQIVIWIWYTLKVAMMANQSQQIAYVLLNIFQLYISSWLQGWQLVCLGWLQCDLQWRNQNQNSGGHSATEESGRDVSGSGGHNGLQHWRMPRFTSHLAFWSWKSHLY